MCELNVDDAHATGCHSKARWLFRVASNFTGFDGDSRCSRVQGLVLEGFTVQGLRGRNCKKTPINQFEDPVIYLGVSDVGGQGFEFRAVCCGLWVCGGLESRGVGFLNPKP